MSHPRLFLSPPHMSGRERIYVDEAFASNFIAPVGPQLTRFEQDFCRYLGVEHAVGVASGTAAIHLVLRVLGIKPGDAVICSTLTFCASANPILYQGAEAVFIDADEKSWNLDPQLLADELADAARANKLPRAIVAVDALGQCADLDVIQEVASRYEIPVVQDAAESLGSLYKGKPAGSQAWCSTFSFNGNKIITTSGGGMVCTNDKQLSDQCRYLATQAREPVAHYEHATHGYNYRLSNILAAIGIGQLEVLNDRVSARQQICRWYTKELADLPGITMMPVAEYGVPNCWLTTIQVDAKKFGATSEDIRVRLEKENIESRRVWKPLHQQPAFAGSRVRGGAVSERIFRDGLNLPSGSAMSRADVERVCAVLKDMVSG
jgi:dTDP-4-amino-4,6-dideoxygalactose transaminase